MPKIIHLLIVTALLCATPLAWSASIGIHQIDCRSTTEMGEDELSFVVSVARSDGASYSYLVPGGGALIMDPENRSRIENLLLWQEPSSGRRTLVAFTLTEDDGEEKWRLQRTGKAIADRMAEFLLRAPHRPAFLEPGLVQRIRELTDEIGDDDIPGQFVVELNPGMLPIFHSLRSAQARSSGSLGLGGARIDLFGDGSRYEATVGVIP